MDSINYFLLTEVKAKNISTVEGVANFCLKPAQFLWNGKKIDFIQEANKKAAQIDFIYKPEERSWVKTTSMIILLIPSTLLGAALKTYAVCRYHKRTDDVFLQKCLQKGVVGKIYTQRNQSEFGKKIHTYISTLQSTGSWNGHLKDVNKPLFLSEVGSLRLLYEENHPNGFGEWNKQYAPEAVGINRKILNDIHFLWNLSYINLVDHYAVSQRGIEVSALKEINPSVIALQLPQLKFTETVKAKVFFSQGNFS